MAAQAHSFHIPVMGTSYTIDTPIKVAHYGISSCVSLVDDMLLERMRKFYSNKSGLSYTEIPKTDHDRRAKRTKDYLNLIHQQVNKNFEELKNSPFEAGSEIEKYFELLPDLSPLKIKYTEMCSKTNQEEKEQFQEALRNEISVGEIDVNIMTKLDRANYKNKTEQLPVEYNDAHASLRGFAESELSSTLVLSAGMNPSLYAYLEEFEGFFPNEKGELKKKLALKVSDYRSALIQGKFLAKKGIWVSEYRIESGLNCGGHAFATQGNLMGPILEEFKNSRDELAQITFDICKAAWETKQIEFAGDALPLKITAQGGIGTSEEQNFLIDEYEIESSGWGTPFLLVPEVCTVDDNTMHQLSQAKEKDLYLSPISPLGVPFNTLRGNTKDEEMQAFVRKDRPGSSCPKEYLALQMVDGKSMCTASRQYQDLKIKEVNLSEISEPEKKNKIAEITVKSCLCTGLAAPAYLVNNIQEKGDTDGVSICPGPNMAYFDKVISLKEMVGHIYGKINVLSNNHRPHMFIKELGMYVDYLQKEVEKTILPLNKKKIKYFDTFRNNLLDGISYYEKLFSKMQLESNKVRKNLKDQLVDFEINLKTYQFSEMVDA